MRKVSHRVALEVERRRGGCARRIDGDCAGRITWEHAVQFGGRQVDEAWAIVKLCAYHHAVDEYQDRGDLNKEKNLWIALNQAGEEELRAVSKAVDYKKEKERLNRKYGIDD